jgi:hypothetical protein
VDRYCSVLLFVLSLGLGCVAVILTLSGFIEYLQSGRWPAFTLLQMGYDSRLLNPRWFLANPWSWSIQEVLSRAPGAVVALLLAPLCWWMSGRLGRR